MCNVCKPYVNMPGTEPEDDDDVNDIEEMRDETEEQDELEQAMQHLKAKGVFAVRCAAHSLQV